jgi:hypothetical protein
MRLFNIYATNLILYKGVFAGDGQGIGADTSDSQWVRFGAPGASESAVGRLLLCNMPPLKSDSSTVAK